MEYNIKKFSNNIKGPYYYFCSRCHYQLSNENIGSNFCPHCSHHLFWGKKAKNIHFINYKNSLDQYDYFLEKEKRENDNE